MEIVEADPGVVKGQTASSSYQTGKAWKTGRRV